MCVVYPKSAFWLYRLELLAVVLIIYSGVGCGRPQKGVPNPIGKAMLTQPISTSPTTANELLQDPHLEVHNITTQPASKVGRFVKFCENNGVVLVALNSDEFQVIKPASHGYRLAFAFKTFPVGTSAAIMRESLTQTQLAFPHVNESAGLAMSAGICHGDDQGFASNAAKDSAGTERRVIDLFNNFRGD